jgi:hypothetical protein
MAEVLEQMELRPDVLSALRELAASGASVRMLTDEVRARLGCHGDSALPFLWYFSEAFALALPEVLPLREWLDGGSDAEIDAVLLPRIARTKANWMAPRLGNGEKSAKAAYPNTDGTTVANQRG